MANKKLAKRLPPIDATNGKSMVQKIKYTCGCEVVGPAPMPSECPTHGAGQLSVNNREVLVNVILDESGSMSSVRDQTIQGYNEYLHGLRQDPKNKYLVTLTKFDSTVNEPTCRVQYVAKPINEAPELTPDTYFPRGSTPLYDAIGGTIRAVEKSVNWRPVLTIIVTDGEENASREFTLDTIKALIKEKEALGNWTFVYLGANQDAWRVGQQFGMSQHNTKTYAQGNVGATVQALSDQTVSYATSMATAPKGAQLRTMSFFDDSAPVSQSDLSTTASQLGSLGGTQRMKGLTPEQRKFLAKKAANARWKK
jgi:uncharacterized protein YegL